MNEVRESGVGWLEMAFRAVLVFVVPFWLAWTVALYEHPPPEVVAAPGGGQIAFRLFLASARSAFLPAVGSIVLVTAVILVLWGLAAVVRRRASNRAGRKYERFSAEDR